MSKTKDRFFEAQQNKLEDKRWCANHPTAYWGKDQFGDWYAKCVRGNQTGEVCEMRGGEK